MVKKGGTVIFKISLTVLGVDERYEKLHSRGS